MVDTSAYEPECEDTWCALKESKRFDVRGQFGRVLSGDGVARDLGLDIKMHEKNENDKGSAAEEL